MSERLVVIGGDAAGMSAAAEARRAGPAREIVVLERGSEVSYSACGIPYLISGEVEAVEDLVQYDPAYFRDRRGIDVRTGTEATAIDPEARRVTTAEGDEIAYGALILATGARPARPPVPGADHPGLLELRDLSSARRLDELLRPIARPRAVLVGAGPIGVEMAEALLAREARVTVLEVLAHAVPALGDETAAPVAAAMEAAGVDLRAGAALQRVAPAGDGFRVTADGASIDADLVLMGTGVTPNSELARDAGCALGERGAIAVDPRGRTSVAGIWAAGDCATAFHRVLERDVWMPLATTANRQGRVAARDIAGVPGARFPGVLGAWVSRFGEIGFGATGVDERAAARAGFAPAVIAREGRDRSGYMPGARRVVVRLVWDEPTGRLLGGQVAGSGEVAQRLHALSVAISAGLTIRGLADCDFGYAPPVSSLRDPLQLAAAAAIGDAP